MKTLGFRDLGDPAGFVHCYVGPLADVPGPAHVRRRIAALRELRGLGNARVLLVSGRRVRSLGVRDPRGVCYGLARNEAHGDGTVRFGVVTF